MRADRPTAALELLERLDERLPGHHRLHAVRSRWTVKWTRRSDEYRTAAGRTTSLPEQHYLTIRAARLNERRP